MHSDGKHIGRKLLLPLIVAGLALNLGGCASMQLTNAQFWAEEAADIAENCPAGQAAAQAAAQAAENARDADQRYQQASQQEASLRQELAVAQSEADYYNRRADNFQASIDAYQEASEDREDDLRAQISACSWLEREYYDEENDWLPDMMIEISDCNSSCETSGCLRNEIRGMRDDLAHMTAVREGAEEAERFRDSARAEAEAKTARLAEVTSWVEAEASKASAALSDLRQAEEEAHRQLENATALCDGDPLTGATLPPATTGLFEQDVYGAQSVGLPGGAPVPPPPAGSCPVGSPLYFSCQADMTMCSVCTGDCPPTCDPCRAAGCF